MLRRLVDLHGKVHISHELCLEAMVKVAMCVHGHVFLSLIGSWGMYHAAKAAHWMCCYMLMGTLVESWTGTPPTFCRDPQSDMLSQMV